MDFNLPLRSELRWMHGGAERWREIALANPVFLAIADDTSDSALYPPNGVRGTPMPPCSRLRGECSSDKQSTVLSPWDPFLA